MKKFEYYLSKLIEQWGFTHVLVMTTVIIFGTIGFLLGIIGLIVLKM